MRLNFPTEYCVYDFETSGLLPAQDYILEIGALRVVNGKEEYRGWILNWGIPISDEITKLTGITQELIQKEGVYPPKAIEEFNLFRSRTGSKDYLPMIGHNIIKFDNLFLVSTLRRLYPNVPEKYFQNFQKRLYEECVDTAALYKAQKLGEEMSENETLLQFFRRVMEIRAFGVKFNVGVCCDELGIDRSQIEQHRTSGDVYLTHEIFKKLRELNY